MKDLRAKIITLLGDYSRMHLLDGNVVRSHTYSQAMQELMRLKAVFSLQDLEKVPGLGRGVITKLRKMMEHGSDGEIRAWKARNKSRLAFVERAMLIPGMTVPGVLRKYDREGVRNMTQLRRHLTPPQAQSLRYLKDLARPIGRSEVEEHINVIGQVLRSIDGSARMWEAGGYRRAMPFVPAVEVLVTSQNHSILNDAVARLRSSGYAVHAMSLGPRSRSLICKLEDKHRRIDLAFANEQEAPFALLHLTGPPSFITKLQRLAAARGMRLTDRGIFDAASRRRIESAAMRSERGIFEFFGIPYLEPHQRASFKEA